MSLLLGLDRKAMEEARLARLANKRQADTTLDERPFKSARHEAEIETTSTASSGEMPVELASSSSLPSKSSMSISDKSQKLQQVKSTQSQDTTNGLPQNENLQYPRGVLKKTWALGVTRTNDIMIEEVLQNADLTTAVISSWQWDFDWLVSKVLPGKTKFVFVMEAKSEVEKASRRAEFAGLEKTVRLCFPPISGSLYARMHSKLMLLFHPTHLRVVVPSANPVKFDWGEDGHMENSVFILDLPRLPRSTNAQARQTPNSFEQELKRYLDAMGLQDDVKQGLSKFDFSAASDVRFVHSIPGSYILADDNNADKRLSGSGLLSLSSAIRSLNITTDTKERLEADYAASSLGSLDIEQIRTMQKVLRGLQIQAPSKTESVSEAGTFRVLFPTRDNINTSKGGQDAAGTIFLQAKAFNTSKFPKEILHDYKSRRTGLLSHNKLIIVRSQSNAFVYSGSANFSQSAWGRLSHPKGSSPKLTVTNWECGVLMVAKRGADTNLADKRNKKKNEPEGNSASLAIALDESSTESEGGSTGRAISLDDSSTESEDDSAQDKQVTFGQGKRVLQYSAFDGVIDIPFAHPPQKYKAGELPWMQ